MLTIFNRESVWVGTDADRFYEIRTKLRNADIPHRYKVKNRLGQSGGHGGTVRGSYGSFGMASDQMYQYEIFVHRKDLSRAQYTIR